MIKESTTIFVQNWMYLVNTKEKWALLIWNLAKIKKWTSRKCDLSCLTLLLSTVGWDINRYASEPLSFQEWVRYCPLTMLFIYTISLCHLTSLSAPFLAPSTTFSRVRYWSHHSRNLLDPGIRSSPVHILHMGWLYKYSSMVSNRLQMYSFIGHRCRLQGLLWQRPLTLPLPNSSICHPCNPPRNSMLEPLQHLQHWIFHYPTLAPAEQHHMYHCLVHSCDYLTVSPVFTKNFTTIPHCRCAFLIFFYRYSHLILLTVIVHP